MQQTGVLIADNLVLTSMHGFIRKDFKQNYNMMLQISLLTLIQ